MSADDKQSASTYRKRAWQSLVVLGTQNALRQVVVFGANIYLARTLSRVDYGIFGILQFAMSFFKLVGDGGLAKSLIQREEQPEHEDLSGLWWVQLALASGLVALAFITSPLLPWFYDDLPESAVWMMRGLSLCLLFAMLRATPFLLLERHLHFGKISALEFAGTLVFYGTAMYLASVGAGAASLVTATAAQAALIALVANIIAPFRPAFVFNWDRIKGYVRSGLSFQGIHVVGFINDAAMPLLVGARMGTDALGTAQFAQRTAWMPNELLSIVRRVSFPYFSRLQNDKEAFAREFNNAIALCAVPVYFFAGLFVGNGETIVTFLYSDKWLVAVPTLIVFSLTLAINFFGWIAGAALEALGQPGVFLRFIVLATVINWVACTIAVLVEPTPLSFAIGFSAHVVINNILLFFSVRRRIPGIRPIRRTLPIAFAGAVIAGLGRAINARTTSIAGFVLWSILSVVAFATIVLLADRNLRQKFFDKVAQWRAHKSPDAPES